VDDFVDESRLDMVAVGEEEEHFVNAVLENSNNSRLGVKARKYEGKTSCLSN
jgi:adenylate cyclase